MGARTDRRFQSADTIAALPRPEGFADDWLGQVLDGRYEIQQFLAEGGTGLVFRGVHQTLGRPVAIKVLRKEYSQLAEALERFRREARAATAVGNPHIVTIYDFGRLEGRQAYVVMELLDGVELAAILERQPQVPWTRAVDIVLQLTEGMAAAHAAGIIHRDLKPENVVLVRDPETGAPSSFVKILDFGVAKFQGAQVRLTGAGRMVGTPEYMAPEQCTGGAVDVRTDIYALGVMLYEMLMGRLPFAGGTLEECVRQHLQDPPPAFRKVGPDIEVPSGLEKVVRRCLAKAQDDRFGSMGELAAALAPFLERDTTAIPLSSRRPTVKAARMSRRWALGALAAVVLVGLVAGWALVGEALVDRALTLAADPVETDDEPVGDAEEMAGRAAAGLADGAGRPPGEPARRPRPRGEGTEPEARAAGSATPSEAPPGAAPRAPTSPPPPGPEAPEPTLGPVPAGSEGVGSTILLDARPAAVVQDGSRRLGRTPLAVPRPAEGTSRALALSRPGYRTARVVLDAASDPLLRVTLAPRRRAAGREEPREAEASEPPASGDRGRSPVNDVFLDPWTGQGGTRR